MFCLSSPICFTYEACQPCRQYLSEIDSVGTHSPHVGHPADERIRRIALGRGYQFDSIARILVAQDFERFDLIKSPDTHHF